MSYFKKAASLLFNKRYLLVTNTFSNGILMGFGDVSIQLIERRSSGNLDKDGIDWYRTGRLFLIGLGLGPALHFWYKFLDKRLPGANALSVAKKVFLDISIASPICIAYFFIGTNILERRTWNDAIRELKQKFLAVFLVDIAIWPAAQTFNFYLLPPKYRVLYVAVLTYVYNMFLSGMKHMEDTADRLVDFVNDNIVKPFKKK